MLKKISSFIIALIMALLVIPVSAEGTPTSANNEFELISSLGFFKDIGISSCNEPITRGNFAKEAAFLEGYTGNNPIEYLIGRGVISGDSNGNIRENDVITGHEAIKMLVSILGYDIVAQKSGGYPMGYYRTALGVNIIPAQFNKLSEGLTYNDAAELILGAGNAVVANHLYYENEQYLTNDSTSTAFNIFHNIFVYQGIVKANEYTGFEGVSCGENSIKIGGDILSVNDTNANDYLGYNVIAYCVNKDGENIVKYIYPVENRNNVTKISSDNIRAVSGTLQTFTVTYRDENDKQRRIRVSDYYPFYNGKYYEGFSLDSITSMSGVIEFIDNNNDNTYEVVKICDYENYIVDSIDIEKRKVFDKYGKQLTLPEDNSFIFGQNGEQISIENLVPGDVLFVLESEDGSLVKANVLRKVASGTILSFTKEDDRTFIGLTSNREYEISPEFEALVHSDKVEPELGMHVQLKLDINGKVIDVVRKSADAWVYGFITDANTGAGRFEPPMLKIYTQYKTFEIYTLSEKVKIDGVSRKAKEAFNYMINPSTSKVIGQLVKFKLNGNLISEIDTVILDDGQNSLTRMEDLDDKAIYYHKDTRMFFNGFETIVGGDSKTIVFNVPSNASKYEDPINFSITTTGGIGTANGYNAAGSIMIEAYDVDELNIAKVFIRYVADDSITIGRTSPYLIFKEIVWERDSAGDVRPKLIALNPLNNTEYAKFVKSELTIPELSFGDLIRYVERGGEVVNLKKDINDRYPTEGPLNKLSEGIVVTSSGRVVADTDETYVATLNLYMGKLQKIGSEHISVSSDIDGSDAATFMVTSATPIYCCNEESQIPLEKISVNELRNYTANNNPDASICIVSRVGAVEFIIVYTK